MPLQGTLLADFDSFTNAVANAQTSLKGFETDAGKVETSLTRMTNAMEGTKIVQQATLAAQAIEDIGGVTKLTEAELVKWGNVAAEAAAKLTAMGKDVPPQIQHLADATKNAAGATTDWGNALSTAAGYLSAFGINASLSGIVTFTEHVFANASAVHDMAERLGISAEAVQGFQFAAEQAGSTLDAVGGAITKMNKNLAEGDKSTVDALHQAGLEFETIRGMKPEDAFLAITDAIAKIPDPMVQSDLTLKIFGRSAAELLPAIKEGFRSAADGAQKMSNDTVDALERAEDAWNKLGKTVTIATGTILADAVDATTHITASWKNFGQFVTDAASLGFGAATALATMNERVKDTYEVVGPFQQSIHTTKQETEEAAKAAEKYAAAWVELNSTGKSYADTVATINPKIVEQAEYYLKAGNSVATVAAAFPQLSAAQAKALDEMVKAYEATYAAIQKIEGNHVKQQETNYLGLSKAENDATQLGLTNLGKASTEIMAINTRVTDDYKKQSTDRATFEEQKLWEAADAQIAAFQKTGVTAGQVTEFANKLYEETALKASQINVTASATITNITSQAVQGVQKMAAAGAAALQSLQGGEKLPGSKQETDFGVTYIISPTGARIALGAHGEIPKNFDALYSGASTIPQFAGGVQNFGGGLAIVGERGPELVNLPAGSNVLPTGAGVNVTNHFYVNGTAADVARQVADVLMRSLRSTQQFPLR